MKPLAQFIKRVFHVPDFLKRDTLALPSWARALHDHPTVKSGKVSIVIEGDTDGYVREWLDLFGVEVGAADQYWLECAYQCAKMDLQAAIENTQYDPRIAGKPAQFNFLRHAHWQQKLHPPGKGAHRATRGLEAREHYLRIRGRVPF